MNYKEVTVLTGQTLYDIAVQEYGHTEGLFLLLEDNDGVIDDLGETPEAGTNLLVRLEVPELSDDNRAIAAEFARREQKVVSGDAVIGDNAPVVIDYVQPGYWVKNYADWSRLKATSLSQIKYKQE